MGAYRISGDILIYFSLNKPYLINTKSHEEFEINDSELISEIGRFSISGEVKDSVKEVLLENGILVPKDRDEPLSKFGNDFLDLFHKGSNDVLNELNTLSPTEYALTYLESCTLIEGHKPPERKKQNPINGCESIPLPDYDLFFLKNCSLFSALDKRKTVREFSPFKSNMQDLSNLLFTAFGYFHQHKEGEFEEYKPFKRRSSPSGGCLQSIEAFVCVFNVSGLKNGIYWYDAEHHSLLTVHDEISYDDLSAMLASQFFGENCSFGIFLAANLERFTWKYKTTRAYRVVSMEVGHFSQTAQLCAAALQLNTWITGAFNDSKIEQILKIDQEQSIPLFFLAFGNGRYRRMHSLMEQQAQRFKSKD